MRYIIHNINEITEQISSEVSNKIKYDILGLSPLHPFKYPVNFP